jgi:hypothetical protein
VIAALVRPGAPADDGIDPGNVLALDVRQIAVTP